MFDIEKPNYLCLQSKCPYMEMSTTAYGDKCFYCRLSVKERFDECPQWLKDCERVGLMDEPRFEKIKPLTEDGWDIWDNWYGHVVDYLPTFTDEYKVDKFIEFLNEVVKGK